jgi:hypothetical protein
MKKQFESNNLVIKEFTLDKHYDIPVKKVFEGGTFETENKLAYRELSDYYANADLVLRSYISNLPNATPVRCWPHHFDIATLLNIGLKRLQSIGIGLSPGDNKNNEPYFYVTMWPYPDMEKTTFPELNTGSWNNESWIGSSLKATEIIKFQEEKKQTELVAEFIESSVKGIKKVLIQG